MNQNLLIKNLFRKTQIKENRNNASFTFIRDIKVTEIDNQPLKPQEKMIHILPTLVESNKPSLKLSPSYDSFTDGNLDFLNSNIINDEK